MKIAQVAPLIESVPPQLYGGTERIVSYLTEELVRQGHQVTLFASGDSQTSSELVPCCTTALRSSIQPDPLAWHILQLEAVLQRAGEFDVVHFHNDYLHFPMSTRMGVPHLTTLHGRLDLPQLPSIYKAFPTIPLVSISDAQRKPLPGAHWRATIHHGLPESCAGYRERTPEHLLFLGRISPEKRADRAIEIATAAELPLVIAAKVDAADQQYFEQHIAPMLGHPLIRFIGEVGDREKRELLKKSIALLFPIDWPEPFGLVMIEAMACDVPVIAFRCGSVPEVIDHGKTGYIVDSVEDAVASLGAISLLKPGECLETFRRRFTAARMASDYVREYQRLLDPEDSPAEDFELAET